MKQKLMVVFCALAMALIANAKSYSEATSEVVPADTTFVDGGSVSTIVNVDYGPFDWDDRCLVTLDGGELLSLTNSRGNYAWQPRKLGGE